MTEGGARSRQRLARAGSAAIVPAMVRTFPWLLFLLALPSCVLAVGNTGYGPGSFPHSTEPMLQERVDAARRVVELQERKLALLRQQREAGSGREAEVVDAEIAVEQAKLKLSECRAELTAVQTKKKDED